MRTFKEVAIRATFIAYGMTLGDLSVIKMKLAVDQAGI